MLKVERVEKSNKFLKFGRNMNPKGSSRTNYWSNVYFQPLSEIFQGMFHIWLFSAIFFSLILSIRLWFFVHLRFQHFSTGTWVQDFFFFLIRISYLECMFNFRAPLACFITISGHIDIFQKLSIHLPVTRLATSVVLKIEQTLLTQIPTFFSLKSPPVMSKCASIVFYLSILTLEHKLFRS